MLSSKMHSPTGTMDQTGRAQRIIQLAHTWSLFPIPHTPPPPLYRPSTPSTFRTEADDLIAEQLLLGRSQQPGTPSPLQQQRRTSAAALLGKRSSKSNLSAKIAFDALQDYVRTGPTASPGVAEALLHRLQLLGGVLDAAPKAKKHILSRRKSYDDGVGDNRGQILKDAVTMGSVDLLRVLVPYADQQSLDEAVIISMKACDYPKTEVILSYGARVSVTATGQDAYRQLCAQGGHADLVTLILRSGGHPAPMINSLAMVDASRAGCLPTVLALSRSTANAAFNNAEALKIAVDQGRKDIVLAIVMSGNPPERPGVDECFTALFAQQGLPPGDKLAIAELLLCAGAAGEAVDIGLLHAASAEFLDLVSLLVAYGASLTFREAHVVRDAVSKGQHHLVERLLDGDGDFNSTHASQCLAMLPVQVSPETRLSILKRLLRRGAHGEPVHNALIDAVEASDMESARLLITPHVPMIPGSETNGSGMHETASVDYKAGLAFSIAVTRGDVALTKLLLSARPSHETLAQIFPAACVLSSEDARHRIVEVFLRAGLYGAPLDAALREAVSVGRGKRDEKLINLLLANNANVNSANGEGLSVAAQQGDIALLRSLVSTATPETAGKAVPDVMRILDPDARREAVGLLLDAGASQSKESIAVAVIAVLSSKPVDVRTLRLLLEKGKADLRLQNGAAVSLAIKDPDQTILAMMVKRGDLTSELLMKHAPELWQLPSTHIKTAKLQVFVPHMTHAHLNVALLEEVKAATQTPQSDLSLSTLTAILSKKPSVDSNNAQALCIAISAANQAIVDALLECKPSLTSLSLAFPYAVRLEDPAHRFTFTKRLIDAGAPKRESTRALAFCVEHRTTDMALITLLTTNADTSDGIALGKAVKVGRSAIVQLLIEKGVSTPTAVNEAFAQSMSANDRGARLAITELLLGTKKVSADSISAALVTAVDDIDPALVKLLIEAGAVLQDRHSKGVIKASRMGSEDLLSLLLSGMKEPNKELLEAAFQAATEVGDLEIRASILQILLDKGVSGRVVDEQLVSASRYGERGHEMLRMLLSRGANPNYMDGESVCAAVRSANLANLDLLLGLAVVNASQEKPNMDTLSKVLKSTWKLSREVRYNIVRRLFDAGLGVTPELHMTLKEIVKNEDDGDDVELVKLLVDNGASPHLDGFSALIDVAARASVPLLTPLLHCSFPVEELDRILQSAFRQDNTHLWLKDEGVMVLKMLLTKAPGRRLSGATVITVMNQHAKASHDLVSEFVTVLTDHGVDVNHDSGKPLHVAMSIGKLDWAKCLLKGSPSSAPMPQTLSSALWHIFDGELDEDDAVSNIKVLVEYEVNGARLDPLHAYPGRKPLLVTALEKFPRSTKVLKALLDGGFFHDQLITYPVYHDIQAELVTLLTWALLQPQKRVSAAVIELLVTAGANVNVDTKISRVTPLMLAIETKRQDIVKLLLRHGAAVDGVKDRTGTSLLSMAVRLEGGAATEIIEDLLASSTSTNDGSLHNAARELNLPAVQVLMEHGHDPDFPSLAHGGRTALAEVCRHAAVDQRNPEWSEPKLEKMMTFLIDHGSDVALKSEGKPLLYLAFEAREPVVVTRALLKSGMWKHVNKSASLYSDGTCTYSPTMYVQKFMKSPHSDTLYFLLRTNRCEDIFYANEGPQPEGAVGMPEDILVEERARKARLHRLACEQEESALAERRMRALEEIRRQLYLARIELENTTRQKQHDEEVATLRNRGKIEQELFNAAAALSMRNHETELQQQEALRKVALGRVQKVGDLELEYAGKKSAALLDLEEKRGRKRLDIAKALNALEIAHEKEMAKKKDPAIPASIAAQGNGNKSPSNQFKPTDPPARTGLNGNGPNGIGPNGKIPLQSQRKPS